MLVLGMASVTEIRSIDYPESDSRFSNRLPSWMKDPVPHLGRERVCDIGLARIDGAKEVPCGIRRRPLDRGAGVLILSPESGRAVRDLQPLSRPRPMDIDTGHGGERYQSGRPKNRVHRGEIVEHSEI
jgi:hypothetical protein